MKITKKHTTKPALSIKPLDLQTLAKVTGGGLSGPDTYPAWMGVMEPVNRNHMTEFELMQDC